MIRVLSSKTNRYKNRVFEIPILPVDNSWFCVVSLLKEHFRLFPAHPSSPLFRKRTTTGSTPLQYRELLSFLKSAVTWIGLNPANVGLHSLRRSGAAFLHDLGIPLQDIKSIGDWSSLAVLMYLCTPFERKCDIELLVAQALARL